MDAPGPTPFVRAAMRNCQQQLVPCSSPVHPGLGSRFAREDAPVSSSVSDRSVMEETECSSLWPPEADSRGGDLRILRHKLLTAEEKVCALTRELAQEEQARARLSHQLLALEDEYQRIQAEYAMAAELYADKHELLRKGNERVHRLAEENQNLLTCLDSKIGELRSVKKLVQNTLSQVDTKLHVLLAEGLSVVSVLTAKWRSEELQAAFERKSLSHLQLARLAVMQCGIGSPEGRGPIPPLERREHRASNQRSDATDKEEVVATLPRRCESGGPSGQLNQTERLTICTMEGREAKCAAVAFFSSTPSSAAKAGRAPASREQADPLSDKPSGRGGALRGDRSVVTGSVLPSLESSRPLVRRTMSDQFPARAGKRKSSANEVAIRRHGEKKAQHADSPHQVTARSTRHRMSLDGINQAPKRPLADSVSDPDLETSSQTCNAQKSPSVRSEHTQTGTLSAASLAKRQTMPFLLPASKAKRRLLPELHTARKLSASWAGSTLMSHRSSTAIPSRSARNEPGIRAKSSSKNTTPAATFQAAARSSPFSPSAPVGKVKNPRGSLYVPNSVELRPANSHPIERSTSSATPVSAVKTGVGRTTIHSLSKGHAPTHNALPGVPASKRPSPAAAGKLLLEQPCCNVSPPGSGRGAVSPRQLSTKTPKPNCQQRSTASSGELGSGQCEAVSKDTTLAAPEAMNAGNGVLSDTEASRAPMTDSSADVSTGDRSALKLPPLPPSRWPSHVRQSLPSSIGGARRLAIQSVTSAPTGEPLSSAGSQLDSEQLDTMSGGLSSSHLVGPSCLESPFDALCSSSAAELCSAKSWRGNGEGSTAGACCQRRAKAGAERDVLTSSGWHQSQLNSKDSDGSVHAKKSTCPNAATELHAGAGRLPEKAGSPVAVSCRGVAGGPKKARRKTPLADMMEIVDGPAPKIALSGDTTGRRLSLGGNKTPWPRSGNATTGACGVATETWATDTEQRQPISDPHGGPPPETPPHDLSPSEPATSLTSECRCPSGSEPPEAGCHPGTFSTRSTLIRSSTASSLAGLSDGLPGLASDAPHAPASSPDLSASTDKPAFTGSRKPSAARNRPASSRVAMASRGVSPLSLQQSETASLAHNSHTETCCTTFGVETRSTPSRDQTTMTGATNRTTALAQSSAVVSRASPSGRSPKWDSKVSRSVGGANGPHLAMVEPSEASPGASCSRQLAVGTEDWTRAAHEAGFRARLFTEECSGLQHASKGKAWPAAGLTRATWINTPRSSATGHVGITRRTLPTAPSQEVSRAATGSEPARSTLDRCRRSAEFGARLAEENRMQSGVAAGFAVEQRVEASGRTTEAQSLAPYLDGPTIARVVSMTNQERLKDSLQDLRRANESSFHKQAYSLPLRKELAETGPSQPERTIICQQLGEAPYSSIVQQQHVPPQGQPVGQTLQHQSGQRPPHVETQAAPSAQVDEKSRSSHGTRHTVQPLQQHQRAQGSQPHAHQFERSGKQCSMNQNGNLGLTQVEKARQSDSQAVHELSQQFQSQNRCRTQDQYHTKQRVHGNVPQQMCWGRCPSQSAKMPQHELLQGSRPLPQVRRPCAQPCSQSCAQSRLSDEVLPQPPPASAAAGQRIAPVPKQGHLQLQTPATRLIHPAPHRATLSQTGLWSPQHQNNAPLFSVHDPVQLQTLRSCQPRVPNRDPDFQGEKKAGRALQDARGQLAIQAHWQRRGSLPAGNGVATGAYWLEAAGARNSPSDQQAHSTRLPNANSRSPRSAQHRTNQLCQSEAQLKSKTGQAETTESGTGTQPKPITLQSLQRTQQQDLSTALRLSQHCQMAQQPQELQHQETQATTQGLLYSGERPAGTRREWPAMWHLNAQRQPSLEIATHTGTQLLQQHQPMHHHQGQLPNLPAMGPSGQMFQLLKPPAGGFLPYATLVHGSAPIPVTQGVCSLPDSSQYGTYATGAALGLRQTAPSLLQMKPTN